jgi:hypothetical protein
VCICFCQVTKSLEHHPCRIARGSTLARNFSLVGSWGNWLIATRWLLLSGAELVAVSITTRHDANHGAKGRGKRIVRVIEKTTWQDSPPRRLHLRGFFYSPSEAEPHQVGTFRSGLISRPEAERWVRLHSATAGSARATSRSGL